jgi:hypothetical protein
MNGRMNESVSASIVQLVTECPQQSISGSKLFSLLRARHPEFNIPSSGCRNLRSFIRSFVPQITESQQRAGMDVIYVLKSANPAETKEQGPHIEPSLTNPRLENLLLNNPRAWKTFASPLSTSRIFVKSDGSDVVVSSGHFVHIGGDWLQINPISADLLLQIAKDFIESVPELFRHSLTESIEQPKWWIPFFDLVGSLGFKSRWILFRRRRILDEFVKAVKDRTTSKEARGDDLCSGSRLQSQNIAALFPSEPAQSAQGSSDQKLRDLVVYAVQHMTASELRRLVIPLGYIADALEKIP